MRLMHDMGVNGHEKPIAAKTMTNMDTTGTSPTARYARTTFPRLIPVLLMVFTIAGYANAAKVRNILVLHSYHQGLQWTDDISDGIQSVFESDGQEIEIHYEYLDTKRNPGEVYFKQLAQFESFKTKLMAIDFEVIISSDNNALRFLVEYGDSLFPHVPVVFCGVNNFTPKMLKGKTHITGVVEALDFGSTLDVMRTLHPTRNRVLIILDRTPTGIAVKQEMEKTVAAFADQLTFEFFQNFILEEVPQKISALGSRDIIYMLTFNRDREGNFISYVDGIRMVHGASKVPIYGSWDFYYGQGIVGGMITSGFAQGEQAARQAKLILAGKPVDEIAVVTQSPNKYMFDHAQMSRFGIKASQLPSGSHIINEPPGFIDRFKELIISVLCVVAGMALILGWRLAVQRRKQAALYKLNVELDRRVAIQTAELKDKNDLLHKEIDVRLKTETDLRDQTERLEHALSKVKTLSGLLPICANCKNVRDDKGYWKQIESYIDEHSEATFSHSICPDCAKVLYPGLYTGDK